VIDLPAGILAAAAAQDVEVTATGPVCLGDPTGLTVHPPATCTAGEVMFLVVRPGPARTPAGWTLAAAGEDTAVFYRTAGVVEDGPRLTFAAADGLTVGRIITARYIGG
jgi:hypothetical protein